MAGLYAELFGRASGLMGGKGGSMHITSAEHNMLGSYAIVGAHLPIALGAAWSAEYRGTDQVAVCFFGDGTTNIGAFHEALNMAVVWRLPVVYVCENNLYSEWSAMGAVTAGGSISARASAYGIPGVEVDGNDVLAVRETAGGALTRARSGAGPTLVEAKTYRHKGHSRVDPGKYRPKEEVDEWLGRDPIPRLAAQLGEEAATRIEERVRLEIDQAVEAARGAPYPSPVDDGSAYKGGEL
jgi:pyruvate dehydrogenase E1 component alpha subunit